MIPIKDICRKWTINAYQKEQIQYIKDLINKIRNSVENNQSQVVWQSVS